MLPARGDDVAAPRCHGSALNEVREKITDLCKSDADGSAANRRRPKARVQTPAETPRHCEDALMLCVTWSCAIAAGAALVASGVPMRTAHERPVRTTIRESYAQSAVARVCNARAHLVAACERPAGTSCWATHNRRQF